MRILARVLLNGLALVVAAKLVPGIHWTGGLAALVVAGCVVGLINLLVRPVVELLSCPLVVVTLGLFYLVINGGLLLLAARLLPSLAIDGWIPAIVGGLLLSLWNLALRLLIGDDDERRRAD